MVKAVLEKVDRIGSLFELYGDLLTPRQKELTRFYYFDDLSLAEIAEELGISRQAVFFGLKRSEEILEEYEEALGLFSRNLLMKSKVEEAKSLLAKYRGSGDIGNLDVVEVLLDSLLD